MMVQRRRCSPQLPALRVLSGPSEDLPSAPSACAPPHASPSRRFVATQRHAPRPFDGRKSDSAVREYVPRAVSQATRRGSTRPSWLAAAAHAREGADGPTFCCRPRFVEIVLVLSFVSSRVPSLTGSSPRTLALAWRAAAAARTTLVAHINAPAPHRAPRHGALYSTRGSALHRPLCARWAPYLSPGWRSTSSML